MSSSQASVSYSESRRTFLKAAPIAATTIVCADGWLPLHGAARPAVPADSAIDSRHMRDLVAWTALTMSTPNPVPFGAEIVHTKNSERLVRALNAVFPQSDPSAHAEVHTIRLACNMLKKTSLAGYTLYTTCEPCPMCMACALWSGLDRVVYGATIADAARYTHQIMIPAAELVKRSDMACVVDGPVEHEACLALFTNPKMQKTFAKWK
jgi:tRNA(Arg) A34 adenosine deaminase TadA